jgi:dTDP-4-amino-4,6-dideoxygalactose transaminase
MVQVALVDVNPSARDMHSTRLESKNTLITRAIVPVSIYRLPVGRRSRRSNLAANHGSKIGEDVGETNGIFHRIV